MDYLLCLRKALIVPYLILGSYRIDILQGKPWPAFFNSAGTQRFSLDDKKSVHKSQTFVKPLLSPRLFGQALQVPHYLFFQ